MSNQKAEINCGCFGCLGPIFIVWLLFFGGCSKLEQVLDAYIANSKVQTQAPVERSVEKPR